MPDCLKDPLQLIGQQVYVYRNLNKSCLSVLRSGKVIAHVQDISLDNVEFRVRSGGRDRTLREGRKNVHAFAIGTVSQPRPGHPMTDCERVTYDPHRYKLFVNVGTGQPIQRVAHCRIVGKEIWILLAHQKSKAQIIALPRQKPAA